VPDSWLQLSLKAPAEALDTLSNFLIERGSPGVVLERDGLRAFFPGSDGQAVKRDVQLFHRALRAIYPGIERQPLRWRVLQDRNWNSSWRRFFSPQRVGRNLWVTPPWSAPRAPAGSVVLAIEPGMAFGTGTHFTTRSCLELIEEIAARRAIASALDVGTGSGILAIALAKLGARRVVALDIDPLALRAAAANARRNGVGRRVALLDRPVGELREAFGLVVANLTAETIVELSGDLSQRVEPGGHLVLSGILRPKLQGVARAFRRAFSVLEQRTQQEWGTLSLRKKA
jgi:ribosomal protein L11 methyltransferase